jgi:hypothetical protein
MIDFLENYLFQVQIVLATFCWLYMLKYIVIQLKEKINLRK